MPRKVSGTPSRPHRKPKKRAPARVVSPLAAAVRETAPERPKAAERPPRSEASLRPAAGRVRAAGAPVIDYHYVIEDLKRVGLIALAMFAVLGVLAVFLR